MYQTLASKNPELLLPLSDVPNPGKHRPTGFTVLLLLLLLRFCYGYAFVVVTVLLCHTLTAIIPSLSAHAVSMCASASIDFIKS